MIHRQLPRLYYLLPVTCYLLLVTICFAQQDISPSQQEKVQKAREYYAAGKLLMQQGNVAAADEQFKKAQLLLQEPIQRGITPLDTNQATRPETSSLAQMALAAAQKGSSDEAISLYQKAITEAMQDANLYYNLALEYLKTKRFSEAAQMFKRVTQLNPKDKDAYFNLGVLYESYLDDKKQALNYYTQYLKYAPAPDNTAGVKEWIRQLKKELKAQ